MSEKVFEAADSPSGDFAGVFEYDGETGYFYLYAFAADGAKERVVDAIHVLTGVPDFSASQVRVVWSGNDRVGLLIRDVLWAVFDRKRGLKYGGNYRPGGRPVSDLPDIQYGGNA